MIWRERGETPPLLLRTAKHGELSEPGLLEGAEKRNGVRYQTRNKDFRQFIISWISDFETHPENVNFP